MSKKEPWYESENPDRVARSLISRVLFWIVAVSLFFALIGGIVWAFKVVTSDVKGQGDAVQIKNDANNRIQAQERFHRLFNDIKAEKPKIEVADLAAKSNPSDPNMKANATGIRLHCLGLVADYNSKVSEYRSKDFLDASLPSQLDGSEYCKGSDGQ